MNLKENISNFVVSTVPAGDLAVLGLVNTPHKVYGVGGGGWWPCKTIRHLFYTTSSFVHHFNSICEFKLELQSGNTQFGSKLVIFLSCVTLKFYGWPWKTIRHLFYTTSSFVHHFKFQIHWYIQTGVTVRKHSIRVKIGNFLSHATLKFDAWP